MLSIEEYIKKKNINIESTLISTLWKSKYYNRLLIIDDNLIKLLGYKCEIKKARKKIEEILIFNKITYETALYQEVKEYNWFNINGYKFDNIDELLNMDFLFISYYNFKKLCLYINNSNIKKLLIFLVQVEEIFHFYLKYKLNFYKKKYKELSNKTNEGQ